MIYLFAKRIITCYTYSLNADFAKSMSRAQRNILRFVRVKREIKERITRHRGRLKLGKDDAEAHSCKIEESSIMNIICMNL